MNRFLAPLLALIFVACAPHASVVRGSDYPPYPPYPPYPAYADYPPYPAYQGQVIPPRPNPRPREVGASPVSRWSYLAGTSGTVTIAAGFAVTGIMTASTAGGTLTVAPTGPGLASPVTGPTITIPASMAYTFPASMLPDPSSGQVADGTVLVFTGADPRVSFEDQRPSPRPDRRSRGAQRPPAPATRAEASEYLPVLRVALSRRRA